MKNILAIDVAHRIPEFPFRLSASYEEVLALTDAPFEALATSIYQSVDEALLKKLPRLKTIFILGTSDKKIDLNYCAAHNIEIKKVKHYCDQETAEWVMLEIVKFFRNREEPLSVMGRRLGIIGLGDVGSRVRDLAQAFKMDVVVNTKSMAKNDPKFLSKEEIFETCDIVSFHTPPETLWLTKDLYERAKSGQGWINTCMGEITKDSGLIDFLAQGRVNLIMDSIAGKSYPNLSSLAKIHGHPAFDTLDSQNRLSEKFLANIKDAGF